MDNRVLPLKVRDIERLLDMGKVVVIWEADGGIVVEVENRKTNMGNGF